MTSLLLLAAAHRHQEPKPNMATFIGTMFTRYSEARTLSGQVKFRQTAVAPSGKAEVIVTTELAIERPGRVRIVQRSSQHTQKPFIFTSDGTEYTQDVYDMEAPAGLRLTYPAVDPAGPINAGRLISFARKGLPDRTSPFLAVAGGAEWDLKNLTGEWVSLLDGGEGEVEGTPCRIVKGKWRQVSSQQATGTFGMWITPAGDLLKYSTEQSFEPMDDDKKPLGKVTIVSEWTGKIAINPTIPDGTFTLVK